MRTSRLFVGLTTALVVSGATGVAAMPAEAVTSQATRASAVANSRVVRAPQAPRVMPRTVRARALTQVTKAVRSSSLTAGVPSSSYTVRGLRTSGSWARTTIVPRRGVELDPATVLLRKSRGTWKVVDLGTAGVGCGVAPSATLAALRLTCPR